MRKDFAELVRQRMATNDKIWVLTGDLGFGVWDKVRDEFPDRFVNCGAAEQAMADIAVGLALSGKIPIVYSITPFLIYRAFETWRTYVSHEQIPVILTGAGRDKDYLHDGVSHWADDVNLFLDVLNIPRAYPNTVEELEQQLDLALKDREGPSFISLLRN